MVAVKRHETPRPETSDFITHSTASSMSFMFISGFLVPYVPWWKCPAAQMDIEYIGSLYHIEELSV